MQRIYMFFFIVILLFISFLAGKYLYKISRIDVDLLSAENDRIEIIHMSNKKLIGISTGMDVGNKQILSACFENGLLVCKIP